MVEDEAIDRLRIEKLVKKESLPYDLTVATTVAEALIKLKSGNFDLAMVDYNLPDGLGLDILKKAGSVPCIFITAQDNTATAVEVMKAGAADFLVKDDLGFNLKLLPTMVERALERKKADELTKAVTRLQKEIKQRKQAEEDLKKTLSLLQATLESTADGILVVDNAGHWTGYNTQFLNIWNLPEDVFSQKDDQRALYHVMNQLKTPQAFLDKVNDLYSQPEAFSHDTLEFKDGRIYERYSRPQLIEGRAVGRVWSMHDNTERLQRERELETVAVVSNALRAAVTRAEMLPIILNQAVKLLDADSASLEFIDPASGDSIMELAYGFWSNLVGMHFGPDQGLNQYIRVSEKPYINNHILEDPNLINPDFYQGFEAMAGAPMIAHGEIMGLLWVGRKAEFTESDLRPLMAIADISANAIRRSSLHEQTEQRLMQLAALRQIDAAINSSHNLNKTLEILLEHTLAQLHADAANILLLDPQSNMLQFITGIGFTTEIFTPTYLKVGESLAGKAALEQKLVQMSDLNSPELDERLRQRVAMEGFKSYFGVPLVAKDVVKGVLQIFHRKAFSADKEWINFLETVAGSAAIAIDEAALFQELRHSNQELQRAYDATIEALSKALDLRDKETEDHSEKVTRLTKILAAQFGIKDQDLIHIQRGALLHDIGKVGVPDNILQKPGPLTDDEWVIMRKHPQYAYDLLSPIDYLQPALDIPYCHHEKWDGSGYPRQLKGEAIPLAARIFAIADVWQALTSDRYYRKAWTKEKALEHIKNGSGTHFDPQVVEKFILTIAQEENLF